MSRKKNKKPRFRRYDFDPALPVHVLRYWLRAHEKWVTVWQPGRESESYKLDPQQNIIWMTGLDFGRFYCVTSMLSGLQDAGLSVLVAECEWSPLAPFHNWCSLSLVYWLYGYLLGRRETLMFRLWLLKFSPALRQSICELAAEYLMDRRGLGFDALKHMPVPAELLLS